MDKKIYTTVIRNTKNEYILGRISGIFRAFSSGELSDLEVLTKEIFRIGDFYISKPWAHQIKVQATSEQYCKMKVVVEQCYPGLCDFDVTKNDG